MDGENSDEEEDVLTWLEKSDMDLWSAGWRSSSWRWFHRERERV